MNDIEIVRPAENFLNHQHMVRQRIHAIQIQPQRSLTAFHQLRVCYRIATRKQGNVMAQGNQFFGQP
jgi:ferritin-like protein